MGIPRVYTQAAEGAIASYDYTDIAEGTGTVLFYGCAARSGALTATSNLNYTLTKLSVYSDPLETSGALTAGVYLSGAFDTSEFNLPQTIEGTGYAMFSWTLRDNAGSGFPFAKVQKWDGTTETTLAHASGAIDDWGNGVGRTCLIKIKNIPRTLFKKGDILRLNAGLMCVTSTGTKGLFAHDPKDRDADYIKPSTDASSTTKLEFHCPFRIDL